MHNAAIGIFSNVKPEDRRASIVFHLWLRAAVVGFGAIVTGIALLNDSAFSPALGLAVLIGGAALGTLAAQRMRAAIARMGDGYPETAPATKFKPKIEMGAPAAALE